MRPTKNKDLHGFAPDNAQIALIIVDAINDFGFEGGKKLFESALPAAKKIAKVRKVFKAKKFPVIYANDNFGKWQSDLNKLVSHCGKTRLGKEMVSLLAPSEDDYFVMKPKHSAFYATPLEVLLTYLGVFQLVICGWTSETCILFTANDAYMRDYKIHIPKDCIASIDRRSEARALRHFSEVLKADISCANY
jgi:nicotinamidase-related amidase